MRVLILALCAAPLACTQTYHPEYHPVTVTTVSQSTNAEVVAPARAAPAGVTPIVIEQPRLADPEVFFQKP